MSVAVPKSRNRDPGGLRTMKRLMAWSVLGFIALSIVGIVVSLVLGSGNEDDGVPIGRLAEPAGALPVSVQVPTFTDATAVWGLDSVVGAGFSDPMAGGVAIGDVDSDGRLDIVVAHGDAAVFAGSSAGFESARLLGVDDAVAVTLADVDLDGHLDILIARTGDQDRVIWGGTWLSDQSEPVFLDLPGGSPSNQLMAGEVSGDHRIDIVRLSRSRGETDVILVAEAEDPRRFTVEPLPAGDRISLSGELADTDDDGLLDIWVTRDIGWDIGPNAVFSRRGDPAGPWTDISAAIGASLRIDGMGLTLADLDGNGSIDAYVSDLGDNEVLFNDDGQFEQSTGTGAARIRPPGSAESIISSSWASGAADFNLDGVLDLAVVNGGFPGGGVRNKVPATSVAVVDSPAILIGIGGGSFVDVWPQLGLEWATADRGLAIGDLDGDGDDDLVVVAVDGTITALRNGTTGPSVTVASAPGCDTTGAIVEVSADGRAITQLLAPHSYAGSHSPEVTVGTLSEEIRIVMTTPSGSTMNRTFTDPARSRIVFDCR